MSENRLSRRQLLKTTLGSIATYASPPLVASFAGGCNRSEKTGISRVTGDEMLEFTAVDALRNLRDGSITAEQYATQLLNRYREHKDLNAVTWIDTTKVLERARAVDIARSKGENLGTLAGLPIVVKDNINTVGFPTTAGTPALKDNFPRTHAPVVETLFRNGAILLAKTNMHELAMGMTTSNPAFGFTKNPYDITRIPGGSSGGTAAAIAARISPAGLGTDTAGSTRIPAAFCGIAGFRPSTGGSHKAWQDEGIVPVAYSVDTAGPMGRTVSDVALLNAVVTGTPVSAALPLRGTRIGVPRGFYWDDLELEVARTCEKALDKLRDAGVNLIEVDFRRWAETAARIVGPFIGMHSIQDLSAFLVANVPDVRFEQVVAGVVSKDVASMLKNEIGQPFSASQAEDVPVLRTQLKQQYQGLFHAADIVAIIYPTEPILAPRIHLEGDVPGNTIDVDGKQRDQFGTMARNIAPASLTGAPSLDIPAGLSSNGLPVGLSLEGLIGDDSQLLGLGLAVEAALGRLPPPVFRRLGS